jgi:hypothetical protein
LRKQLPEVARLKSEGLLNVENIDVFCEKGVFDVEQVNVCARSVGQATQLFLVSKRSYDVIRRYVADFKEMGWADKVF